MTLKHFNPDLNIQHNAYAWRYMNFEKTKDLLFNNVIYFSILDTFNDPIEGVPFVYRSNLQFKNVFKAEKVKKNLLSLISLLI